MPPPGPTGRAVTRSWSWSSSWRRCASPSTASRRAAPTRSPGSPSPAWSWRRSWPWGSAAPPPRRPSPAAAGRLAGAGAGDRLADLGGRLPRGVRVSRPPQWVQLFGSLLVAAAILAIAIIVVTAPFGPASSAELEAGEERLELREEIAEAGAEAREQRLEEGR